MATQIRCWGCRGFFETNRPECPDCGAPRRGRNSYLQTAKLNDHLFELGAHAENERRIDAAYGRGVELPPAKWAKDAAAEMRRNGTLDVAYQTLSQLR